MTNNKKRILKKIEPRKLCFEFFDTRHGAQIVYLSSGKVRPRTTTNGISFQW